MRFRAFGFLPVILCLPVISQTREVTVQQAKIVQVSSSDDSPNINEVTGNVTVIHITCTNVTYCGSDYVKGYQGVYSYASTLPETYYLPKSTISPVSWTAFGAGALGTTGILDSSAEGSSSFTNSSSFGLAITSGPYGLHLGSGTTDAYTGGTMYNWYQKAETDGIGISLDDGTKILLAASAPTTSTSTSFGTGNILHQYGDVSTIALGQSEQASDPVTTFNSWTKGIWAYSSTDHGKTSWQEQSSSTPLPGTTNNVDGAQSYIPLFMQTAHSITLPTSQSRDYAWTETLRLLGSTSFNAGDPVSTIGAGSSLSAWNAPSNLHTGSDKESLTQQIDDLSKTNKKIIGWTIVTEDGQEQTNHNYQAN